MPPLPPILTSRGEETSRSHKEVIKGTISVAEKQEVPRLKAVAERIEEDSAIMKREIIVDHVHLLAATPPLPALLLVLKVVHLLHLPLTTTEG